MELLIQPTMHAWAELDACMDSMARLLRAVLVAAQTQSSCRALSQWCSGVAACMISCAVVALFAALEFAYRLALLPVCCRHYVHGFHSLQRLIT